MGREKWQLKLQPCDCELSFSSSVQVGSSLFLQTRGAMYFLLLLLLLLFSNKSYKSQSGRGRWIDDEAWLHSTKIESIDTWKINAIQVCRALHVEKIWTDTCWLVSMRNLWNEIGWIVGDESMSFWLTSGRNQDTTTN